MKRRVYLVCVLCASALNAFALDREAFTFTKYDLKVRIEPNQHRLAVRGKITLRNDSTTSQKSALLQISSSLDWRSIRSGDKPLQYVQQNYASDIDHTGALSEAVVTLTQAVPPRETIDLEIAYEGVIPLDATRLTRLGTPEAAASSTDWDQIGAQFTAIRGIGYVAWYPVATGGASLSDGDSVFQTLANWKRREVASKINLQVMVSSSADQAYPVFFNGVSCPMTRHEMFGESQLTTSDCPAASLSDEPILILADYLTLEWPAVEILYLRGHETFAREFSDSAERAAPLVAEWFGATERTTRERAKTFDLPFADAAPFESGALLFTPLTNADAKLAGLAAAHQLTHAAFVSSRPWISEGLAHFAQALYLEQQNGRQTALAYMGSHGSPFRAPESTAPGRSEDEANRSLVNTTNDDLYRSKGMWVWWMLREMIGDAALKKALAAYKPDQEKEPSYMPKLIQAQTQRDLEWFFDDWVYRDRGLPDFKIESAFSRKTMTDVYIVTITVVNLGAAGAEVPLTVTYAGGVVTKRLEIRGKSKAVTRVEVTGTPQEVIVNDGSVPENDVTNNSFKIETTQPVK